MTPSQRVAQKLGEAAEQNRKAANRALLPTLVGSAQERITNATGFSGKNSAYTLLLTLSWRLDYSAVATTDAQVAALEVQKVRVERTRASPKTPRSKPSGAWRQASPRAAPRARKRPRPVAQRSWRRSATPRAWRCSSTSRRRSTTLFWRPPPRFKPTPIWRLPAPRCGFPRACPSPTRGPAERPNFHESSPRLAGSVALRGALFGRALARRLQR